MNIEDNGKKEYTEDEMALRIPLLSDIVFKYIFGSEQSTEILKTFINAGRRMSREKNTTLKSSLGPGLITKNGVFTTGQSRIPNS